MDQHALYSPLAQDPVFTEIVAQFVADLPNRVRTIERLLATQNFPQLGRFAHQLKGAAGSYGFPPVSSVCEELELAIDHHRRAEQLADLVKELKRLVSLVQAGSPTA